MLFGVEREREVVQAACNVCETWIARIVPVTPVLHGGAGVSVLIIIGARHDNLRVGMGGQKGRRVLWLNC
jgi:hypothetical protein